MPGFFDNRVGGCIACPPGSETPGKGYGSCLKCAAGKASETSLDLGSRCLDCNWGDFSKDVGASACFDCADYGAANWGSKQYYTLKKGANSCAACPPGM